MVDTIDDLEELLIKLEKELKRRRDEQKKKTRHKRRKAIMSGGLRDIRRYGVGKNYKKLLY